VTVNSVGMEISATTGARMGSSDQDARTPAFVTMVHHVTRLPAAVNVDPDITASSVNTVCLFCCDAYTIINNKQLH